MSTYAVAVMPIVDVEAWKRFAEEIGTGSRAEAHREFLRQSNVTAEHAYHQQTPSGDVMLLVWEGVDQRSMTQRFANLKDATTDHERYLRDVALPQLHGIDLNQPAPPMAEELISITT